MYEFWDMKQTNKSHGLDRHVLLGFQRNPHRYVLYWYFNDYLYVIRYCLQKRMSW